MWTFGFNVGKSKNMTLPSGNKIVVEAVAKIYYRQSEPGIMLRYSTHLNIEDIKALQNEVDEIWSLFKRQADESGLDSVVISANSPPKGKFFIGMCQTRNFAFVKDKDGYWTNNSQAKETQAEDFQIKFGVVETRNDVMLVFEDRTSIPLLTKEDGFYFGFTIFPPSNKPYNFDCTLFSPDTATLSNETGEIVEEIAPSADSQQQFRFPTRRAEGITTVPMWLDKGDPAGEYRLEVVIDGKATYAVDFSVYEPD